MTLDEWIACLEKSLKELKIPDTQKASDWERLYEYLQDYKAILAMQGFKRRYKEREEDGKE